MRLVIDCLLQGTDSRSWVLLLVEIMASSPHQASGERRASFWTFIILLESLAQPAFSRHSEGTQRCECHVGSVDRAIPPDRAGNNSPGLPTIAYRPKPA